MQQGQYPLQEAGSCNDNNINNDWHAIDNI